MVIKNGHNEALAQGLKVLTTDEMRGVSMQHGFTPLTLYNIVLGRIKLTESNEKVFRSGVRYAILKCKENEKALTKYINDSKN